MITFSPIDYAIVATSTFVVAFKIIADIRDIKAANAVKRAAKKATGRSTSPKMTALIQMSSLEDTKQLLQDINQNHPQLSSIVMIDSKVFTSEARTLRYFVKKHDMGKVKVIQTRNIDPENALKANTGSSLAVVLPDTVQLSSSFYRDSILPFCDSKVDAVYAVSSIRPGKTVSSGVEALFAALRQYIGKNSNASTVFDISRQQGMIVRTKHIRTKLKRNAHMVAMRKPTYSLAAQETFAKTWSQLTMKASFTEYASCLVILATSVAIYQTSNSALLALGLPLVAQSIICWWAITAARIPISDRFTMVLLSPLLSIVCAGLLIRFIISRFERLFKGLKLRTRLQYMYEQSARS